MTMFNRTSLAINRIAAVAASTIVVGLAARTTSVVALAPPPLAAALIAAAPPVARATAPRRATRSVARIVRPRRVANSAAARTRCSAVAVTESRTYVHVGGGRFCDGAYHDTHADPVVPGVLHLVEELFTLTDAPGVMLERDDDFPAESELAAELRAIADAVRRGGEHRVRA